MNLPPMPKMEDFLLNDMAVTQMYLAALAAWERVCKVIIDKEFSV